MSGQPERPTPEPQGTTEATKDTQDTEGSGPGGVEAFLKRFLVLQVVFLLFLLIASIPEPPSPASQVSPSLQMAAFAVLWGITDVAALTVQTVRERAHRHPARRARHR